MGQGLGDRRSGQILSSLGPAAEGRLHESLAESIHTTALLSAAIFLNENLFILCLPPLSPRPRFRKGNRTPCFSEIIPNLF